MFRILSNLGIDHLDLLQVLLDLFRGLVLERSNVLACGFNITVNDFLLASCLFQFTHKSVDAIGKVRLFALKIREMEPFFLILPIPCQDSLLSLDQFHSADGLFRGSWEGLHIGSCLFLAFLDASNLCTLVVDFADIFVNGLELIPYSNDLQQGIRFFLVRRLEEAGQV